MGKISIILFACMAMLMHSVAFCANIKEHPRVAVMNFGNKAIMSQGLNVRDMTMAAEYAIYQLSASDWFDLYDYEQLDSIAKMHRLNLSGFVDQSTAVQMGKFMGAQFMVVGNVTGLTTKESEFGYQHGQAGKLSNNQHVVTANVTMRIVDIESGKIVVAGIGSGSSTSTHSEIVFTQYKNKKDVTETITKTKRSDSVTGSVDESINENIDGSDGNVETVNDGVTTNTSDEKVKTTNITYGKENIDYKVVIGNVQVSDIQVRNAIGKAVRDAVYGRMGILTTLNGGKKLKIKTGF